MRVIEVGPAQEASRVEECIPAEGGILEAHIILKNRSIKEGRLAECASGEAGRADGGIAEVSPAQKGGFLEADVIKESAPEGNVLSEGDPGKRGIGNGAVDQGQGFLDLSRGQSREIQVAGDENAVEVNRFMSGDPGQDLLGVDGLLCARSREC